jgi:hypothetical protein
MKHLTIEEIEEYLISGENSLNEEALLHLQHCEKCRNILDEQISAHTLLKKIKPISIGYDLFDKIKVQLKPQRIDFFLDSLFVPSLIMLFIIGLFFFSRNVDKADFNYNANRTITPSYQTENIISWQSITYNLTKPLNNISYLSKKYSNEMLTVIFIMLVFFFYNIVDKYLKRRLL